MSYVMVYSAASGSPHDAASICLVLEIATWHSVMCMTLISRGHTSLVWDY